VGVGLARRTLSGREHHRSIVADEQVDEKGRLLERVGAMRNDNAGELRVGGEQLVDSRSQSELDVRRHARAADPRDVLDGDGRDVRYAGDQRLESGCIEWLLASRDGAACREEVAV